MAIPLYIFYFAYLIFLLIFLFFTYFNIYHLVRFGFITLSNLVVIIFYIIVSILIIAISWNYISQVDWTQSIQVANQFTI